MSANVLHHIVHRGDESEEGLEILRSVLSVGLDVDAQDFNGDTPMHIAAKLNKRKILEVLMKCRPNLTIVNKDDMTAHQCFIAACIAASFIR